MAKGFKKQFAILLCLLCMACMTATAFSANANQDALDYLKKEGIPEEYQTVLYPQLEKIINQLDLTQAQIAECKDLFEDVRAEVGDQGISLHMYDAGSRSKLLSTCDEIAEVCGVTYTIETKTRNIVHKGDVVAIVYRNGVKLGTIDADVTVAKTGE